MGNRRVESHVDDVVDVVVVVGAVGADAVIVRDDVGDVDNEAVVAGV